MANDVEINVVGSDQSGTRVLQSVEQQGQKTRRSIEEVAESTDRLDTASAGLTGSLGALGSGFELLGLEGVQEKFEKTALATDFFSGVGEFATVSIEHLRDGLKNARGALANWDSTAGKATKTTAGVVAVFGSLYGITQLVSKVVGNDLNPQVGELSYELEEYSKSGHTASEITRVFGKDLQDLNTGFKYLADTDNTRRKVARFGQDLLENVVPGLDATDTSLTRTRERVKAFDDALTQLVQSGRADEAEEAFTRFAKSQEEFGVSVKETAAQFPSYSAAIKEATRAGQEQTKTSEGQQVALRSLNEYIRGQIDPIFGLVDAQKQLRDAQKAVNDAVKEHGPKSQEAKDAQVDLAKAATNLASKANDAAGTFNGRLTPAMRQTFKAAGLTESQIRDIEKRFRAAKVAGDRFAKTYQANVRLNYEVINGRFFQNGQPTFNFPMRAAGGPSSGKTLVGEQGPELLDLPPGTNVTPHANTMAMLNTGQSGGGNRSIEVSWVGPGGVASDLGRALLNMLAITVRDDFGGDFNRAVMR